MCGRFAQTSRKDRIAERFGVDPSSLNILTPRYAAIAFALFISTGAAAAELSGKVITVTDGDTITVLVEQKQTKVRLVEIDAPEKGQAFGNRSKQSLSDLCFNKNATLADNGKDRYGRTLARVYCDGVDANAEQVRRGLAWVFDRYVTDKSLYALQNAARAEKRGLWADPNPVPPWEWRHKQRK